MERVFRRLGIFVENKYWLILPIALALIVVSFFVSGQIKMQTGTATMISSETQEYKDYVRFNQDFGSDVIMVMIEGDDLSQLLSLDNLAVMEKIETTVGNPETHPEVIAVTSPAAFIRQAATQQNGSPEIPLDEQERLAIVKDPETGEIAQQFKQVLPSEQYALIAIVLEAELESEILKGFVDATEDAVNEADFTQGVTAVVTGSPALMSQVENMMMTALGRMVLLAIALLFIILALIFKVRGFFPWRWLPLGVVIIGTIYTFALMGIFNVPMTMISMAVFPILIGLGIDYGIQFHNRYDEEALKGQSVAQAIINSITHIGPAVGVALIAGCLGFVALQFSPVPMIQDFGLMLIIGVLAAYIVALFPLPATLYWHDKNKNHQSKNGKPVPEKDQVGFVERSLQYLAPRIIKSPFVIVPIALALTVGGLWADSRIDTATDETVFLSQDIEEVKILNKLRDVAGGASSFNVLIESENTEKSATLEPTTLDWMIKLEQKIRDNHPTDEVTNTRSIADLIMQANDGIMPSDRDQVEQVLQEKIDPNIGKNLISDDYSASNLIIDIGDISDEQVADLEEQLDVYITESNPPSEVEVALTGGPVIRIKVIDAITGGRTQMTLIGIGFIFGGLFLLFRLRVIRAIMATLPIILIIGWSALSMYVMGIEFTPLTATLGALIMGIGVEFTILLMMRYYEERGNGESPSNAMVTAMTKIGRAISVSAFTTIGGFAALLIAVDFPILQDFGIITMTNVFFALVASLFVLPTVIVWIDTRLEKRRIARFL